MVAGLAGVGDDLLDPLGVQFLTREQHPSPDALRTDACADSGAVDDRHGLGHAGRAFLALDLDRHLVGQPDAAAVHGSAASSLARARTREPAGTGLVKRTLLQP